MKIKTSTAEKIAYEAGQTAAERIGEKPLCYDPIMDSLVIEAQSPQGRDYNRRIMNAWFAGRGWKIPESE